MKISQWAGNKFKIERLTDLRLADQPCSFGFWLKDLLRHFSPTKPAATSSAAISATFTIEPTTAESAGAKPIEPAAAGKIGWQAIRRKTG